MPEFANFIGVSGRVTLTCQVTQLGPPERCVIDEEVPTGLGFGAAAVQVAQTGILSPRTSDGIPTPSPIRTTVNFQAFPVDQLAETTSPLPHEVPSARAIDLASEIVRQDVQALSRDELYPTGGLAPDRARLVRQWFDELIPIDAEQAIRAVATTLAVFVTEAELDAFIRDGTPFSSPWPSQQEWMEACSRFFSEADEAQVVALRNRYCERFECSVTE